MFHLLCNLHFRLSLASFCFVFALYLVEYVSSLYSYLISALNEKEAEAIRGGLVIGGILGLAFIIIIIIILPCLFRLKCFKKKDRRVNHSQH